MDDKLTNYNETLTQDYGVIRDKVRRGMLPLVARNPAIAKAVDSYAVAHAGYYDDAVANGGKPAINYKDNDAMDRMADLIMHEELTWSHPDKMSIVEFPVMSDRQEFSSRDRYTVNSDLQYGDRRFEGRRKTSFTDKFGAPQVRNPRVADPYDPEIDVIGEYEALYEALDNAGLTDRQRQVIELLYFGNEGDGMETKEVATTLGVTRQAVTKFERAAIAKLREYMTKV